jgi:hypothetical protein
MTNALATAMTREIVVKVNALRFRADLRFNKIACHYKTGHFATVAVIHAHEVLNDVQLARLELLEDIGLDPLALLVQPPLVLIILQALWLQVSDGLTMYAIIQDKIITFAWEKVLRLTS